MILPCPQPLTRAESFGANKRSEESLAQRPAMLYIFRLFARPCGLFINGLPPEVLHGSITDQSDYAHV